MVHIHIDPILFRWGPIALSWHGLFLAAGLVLGYFILKREGVRRGFPRHSLSELALWLAVLGFVGARMLHVVEHWDTFAAQPARVFAVPDGGLTINGGILGGMAATFVFARREQLGFWGLMDVVAIAAPLGFAVGRLGCLIEGDVWGVPTDGTWGLVYWHPDTSIAPDLLGVPTFPAPVVLQLWNLGLCALLLALRGRAPYDGFLFSTFLVVYGAGRFIVNVQQAGEALLFGLKFIQIVGLGFIFLGIVFLVYLPSHAVFFTQEEAK
jgi:phosphatidylglycerol:prolipoprotein diacylglycerol transferase